ncbi:hypothetical protein [Ligilactobacillus agilis]|uniref:hypothetical protein n=2 Tax=Ligilactobacillus agilis TaxID=1601 RepID=UPI0026305B49|nr:hypothetical protein [Ligilactobacillus agilis]
MMIEYYTIGKDYNLNMPLPIKGGVNDQLEVLNKNEFKLLKRILNDNKYYADCLDELDKRVPYSPNWGSKDLYQTLYSRLYRAITMKKFYLSDSESKYVMWIKGGDYKLYNRGELKENEDGNIFEGWPVLTEHEFEELKEILDYCRDAMLSNTFEILLDETDGVTFTERGFYKIANILINGGFAVEVRHDLDGD